MTLDIVIPVLNEEENLKVLIPYLKNKLVTSDTGIIVVDSSKSNDNSESICREADITYLKSEVSRRSIQMNQGAQRSDAEVLMFLHADVRPPDIFVHDILSIIYSGIEFGLFTYRFDKNTFPLSVNSRITEYRSFFTGGGDQSHFMTKRLFNELGGYDENYRIMEDFEFFDRVKRQGHAWELAKSPALVSSRKYKKNGYLKVQWVNYLSYLKYRLGFSNASIIKTYKSLS